MKVVDHIINVWVNKEQIEDVAIEIASKLERFTRRERIVILHKVQDILGCKEGS